MKRVIAAFAALGRLAPVQQPEQFLDILKTLIRQPSVVGAEHSFFIALRRELEEREATVSLYQGLLVAQGSRPKSGMFSAHIDRHGLVCTGPSEFQYAAYVTGHRSDLLGNSASEAMMSKVSDRFRSMAVIAFDPWSGAYGGSGTISRAYICDRRNNLVFEIEGLEHVVVGTPVAFADRLTIQDGTISAQLDNALTAAHLVHLFSLGYQGTAFFTAQEESGSSWRYLLEWFRRFGDTTNELIVLDTSPYTDRADAERQDVVLRHKDANAPFNGELSDRIERLCSDRRIRFSYKDEFIAARNAELAKENKKPLSFGSTEMGRIIAASNGLVQGTTLQIPTTGYHTKLETASMEANAAFGRVLAALAGCGEG